MKSRGQRTKANRRTESSVYVRDKRISANSFQEVLLALEQYGTELEASSLKPNTKLTYLAGVYRFVRWMDGQVAHNSPSDDIEAILTTENNS